MLHPQDGRGRRPMVSRLYKRTLPLTVAVGCAALLSSCKLGQPSQGSAVKDVACVGSWLSTFIGAIPLPGFESIGKAVGSVGRATVKTVAGTLKSTGSESAKDTCGSPSSFSDEQMKQMRQAITDGFNEQNHKDAIALMNNLATKLHEFVPDQERFTQYTMDKLDSIINDVNTWWSKYDQSGSRIYNVSDFVIVTGFGLKAYQHQVREVALEAAYTKSAGDAKKVRSYAGNLSDKADHVRKELIDISENDVAAVAKSFWKDAGTKQTKTYFAGNALYSHCYESTKGKPYDTYSGNQLTKRRVPEFLAGMKATKTLGELSDYVAANGTICCMDGSCSATDQAIEPIIKQYLDEVTKQVKVVMFTNDPAMTKYIDETLPALINAAQAIVKADDETVFSLASSAVAKGDRSEPVDAPTTGSSGDAVATPADGYPNCTNGDKGDGSWGWDQAVTDPKGTHSCHVVSGD